MVNDMVAVGVLKQVTSTGLFLGLQDKGVFQISSFSFFFLLEN